MLYNDGYAAGADFGALDFNQAEADPIRVSTNTADREVFIDVLARAE